MFNPAMPPIQFGLDADGHPKYLDEVITDIVQEEVKTYIETHLAIEEAGGTDPKVIWELRYGALAEPWLPAVRAKDKIMVVVTDAINDARLKN